MPVEEFVKERFITAFRKASMKKPVDIVIEFSNEVFLDGLKVYPVDRYAELPLNINTIYFKGYIMRPKDADIKAIKINKADSLIAKLDIMDTISSIDTAIIDYDENLKALRFYDDFNKLEVITLLAGVYNEEDYNDIFATEPILKLSSVEEKTIFRLPLQKEFIDKLKKIASLGSANNVKLSINKENGDVYIYPDENVYVSLSFLLGKIDDNPLEVLDDALNNHKTVFEETIKLSRNKIDALSVSYLNTGLKNALSVLDKDTEVELRLLNTGAMVIIEERDDMKALYGVVPNMTS